MGKAVGDPNKPGAVCVGNPCSLGTGNKFQEVTDYTTAGQNSLSFRRYYNSLASNTDPFATELGARWRSNYDRFLDILSPTAVTAARPDGQVLHFSKTGGVWSADSDVDLSLVNTGSAWVLTDHNDTVETYTQLSSGEALLQKIVARDGYTQTLNYNSALQLVTVTDSYGRTLTFTYNSSGLLTQVATPDALVLTYDHDSSGVTPGVNDRLASVAYNTTPATKQIYSYVNNFDLASINDENGTVFASWTYDSQHRVLTSQHGNGAELVTIAYTSDTSRTVTNVLGQQTAYSFTNSQGVPKISSINRAASATVPAAAESFTYDPNGYLASKTDWNGNVTNYTNDVRGNPVSITEAAGTPQARTTTITYSGLRGRQPGTIVAPRETTVFTFDAFGNPLTRTETDTSGGSANGQQRSWTFTHDSTGHRLAATNPLGAVTAFTYSGNNIASVTDALGHVSNITSYNGTGQPLSMTDPNGVVTTLAFDTRNRLLSRVLHDPSGDATTSFAYDAASNLTAITLPNNVQLFYTYDTAHRVIAVKNNVGESIQYTLDANGDITQQQIMGTAIARTQSAVFDSLGRMLKQIGAFNEMTGFAYDSNGNRLDTTNALNKTAVRSFDALNRLIKSVDRLNNPASFAFDAQDNLASVTDPRGLVTSYTYNGFGEVIAQTSPDTGTTAYTLDDMGNRIGEQDARGVVTNRTFDKLNRVLTETYPAAPAENVAYVYDLGEFGIGRLTSFTDKSGSTAFSYNARGDVVADKRVIDHKTYITSYTYDLADNISRITYPDGHAVKYTRDAFGRIAAITLQTQGRDEHDGGRRDEDGTGKAPGKTIVSGVTYAPFGPVTGLTFGNGVAARLTYDQDYRLTGIAAQGRETVQSRALVYDGVSDITSITDFGARAGDHDGERGNASQSQAFTYDADYRLLTATGPSGAESFAYDSNGNRTGEAATAGQETRTSTYTYAAASNQLLRIEGGRDRAFTYTANGDLATVSGGREAQTFAYDSRNRNSSLYALDRERGSGSVKYAYNALGERVSKDSGGSEHESREDNRRGGNGHEFRRGQRHFIYDTQGHLIAEADGSRGVEKEYIYMNGLPVAELDDGNIRYIHTDQLGAPQKMTDESQRIVWDRVSEAFGETLAIEGPATLNLRFPGQYHDAESGIDYNFFRSYGPEIGRYISSDPIGIAGGLNTFGYARANPVNGIDPYGLYSMADFEGDVANTGINLLQGLAGLTDILTLGQSQRYRQQNGLNYADPCSAGYKAGHWAGIGVEVGAVAGGIVNAVVRGAAKGAPTIGNILSDFHPDTLIHLTPEAAADFEAGVDPGTYFARLQDVSEMTVPEYQTNVVMGGAAAGPGQPVAGFVLANPGSAGAFAEAGIANDANVMEYTNAVRFAPSGYVPLP